MPTSPTPSQATHWVVANSGIMGGDYNPRTALQDAIAGTIFVQQPPPGVAPGAGNFGIWEKKDDGPTSNWDPLATNGSLKIAGLYWVGANGSDVITPNSGSLGAPFATPGGAIAGAVAQGHNHANPAIVFVMPKSTPYPAFTTVSGINVYGIHGDRESVIVAGVTVGADPTYMDVTIANMTIQGSTAPAVQNTQPFVGSPSLVTFRNCDILEVGGFNGLLMDSPGNVMVLDNCDCICESALGSAAQVANGTLRAYNGSSFIGAGQALVVGAAGILNCVDAYVESQNGGAQAVLCIGNATIASSKIQNNSAAANSPALEVAGAGICTATDCVLAAAGANQNYVVDAGGTLYKSNLSLVGVNSFHDNGVTVTLPETGLGYTPAVPGNWGPVPTDVGPALDQLAARGTGSAATQSVVGSHAAPIDVTALTTIPFASVTTITKLYIKATAAVNMNGAPNIAPGSADGQRLLICNAGAFTINLPGTAGVEQNGACLLVPEDQIEYSWDLTNWNEISRKQ